MTADSVWFWQRMVSPHMAPLAIALAARGVDVTYVAEEHLSDARAVQGWVAPELPGVMLRQVETREAVRSAIGSAPLESVHICQGVRGNGLVGAAQGALEARGLRQWVVMETVHHSGPSGLVRRCMYSRLLRKPRTMQGVLAIGHRTREWVIDRGVTGEFVFPFAYFLAEPRIEEESLLRSGGPLRIVFVGQLVAGKRVDLLIEALAMLEPGTFGCVVVGDGPMRQSLETLAGRHPTLEGVIQWRGRLPMDEVSAEIFDADCLVLPSEHDGWGAVVSEALLRGVPAICSDACGSAEVVKRSGQGGVFESGDRAGLEGLLRQAVHKGPLSRSDRIRLARWAECLGAASGARYLEAILKFRGTGEARPAPPWQATQPSEVKPEAP